MGVTDFFGEPQRPSAEVFYAACLRRDPADKGRAVFEHIRRLIDSGFYGFCYGQAAADLTAALQYAPGNIDILFHRGAAYHSAGYYREAIADLTEVLRARPGDRDALYIRGEAYLYTQGDDREINQRRAFKDFTDILAKDPLDIAALKKRIDALILLNDYEMAVEDYNTVLKITPKDMAAICGRERVRYQMCRNGWFDRYRRSIRLVDRVMDLWHSSEYHEDESHYDEALCGLNTALDLDPQSVYALCCRATVYSLDLGMHELAFADIDRAIELVMDHESDNHSRAFAFYHRGVVYLEVGLYDRAVADFTEAITLKPTDEDAYIWRADAYIEMENYAAAAEDLRFALLLDPGNAAARIGLKECERLEEGEGG